MSDFWKLKMKTYFQKIDFDKDGAITRGDFEGMANRFKECGKLTPEHGEHLFTALTSVWDNFLSTLSGGESLTQDKFVDAMNKLAHDPNMKDTLQGPLPLFFRAVDNDEDGFISQDEYQLFFNILGMDPSMAPCSFQAIDSDHDGRLSQDEFVIAGTAFFVSEDKSSPSKLFWGPLVQ